MTGTLDPYAELPRGLQTDAVQRSKPLRDALAMWWAGVQAVQPHVFMAREVIVDGNEIHFADFTCSLKGIRRIVVVGAGKASAAMAAALHKNVLSHLQSRIPVSGWINAPAGSFVAGSAGPIHLHVARPAGMNEPTPEAELGTRKIMQLVDSCGPDDLCIVLLSGGGSAILTAPIEGVTLEDKQHVARVVAAAGANIAQLNTVRRALSRVKGGGLVRGSRARQIVTLILSDVLGDPLETIASGPTVLSARATPADALHVLEELRLTNSSELANVMRVLRSSPGGSTSNVKSPATATPIEHIVLANNATAVDAAGVKAVELGYRYIMQASRELEGDVGPLSKRFADNIEQLGRQTEVDCWISGGEPTVKLPARDVCGRGGRNQQLMLLTMQELLARGWPEDRQRFPSSIVCLSAGTDGEDGPTPAAGAWFDDRIAKLVDDLGLDAGDYARRADAYNLFDQLNSLILSEPTGTNVCDLRIALRTQATRAESS